MDRGGQCLKPLILLAPSEEKASGGHVGELTESPAQRWVRENLADLAVHASPAAQTKAFSVKGEALEKAKAEALALRHAMPLMPALARYQGVAFGALDAGSLAKALWKQVYVISNLRGLVRGDEPVPPYKLKLAGIPGLKRHWQHHLLPQLQALPKGEVWALLPGEHEDLLKAWERPRHSVLVMGADGRAISHFSKLYRGRVARWILEHGEGDPAKVRKGKIDGCRWKGAHANAFGGMELVLEVA